MTAQSAKISGYISRVPMYAQQRATDVAPSRSALWAGRILGGLGVLFLIFDAGFKLLAAAQAAQSNLALGWSEHALRTLGFIQVGCLVAYLVPRTRVLGALLWTGYLGGAVATHLRVANPLFSHTLFPVYIATLLWLGLWLRDTRVRSLLPFTR